MLKQMVGDRIVTYLSWVLKSQRPPNRDGSCADCDCTRSTCLGALHVSGHCPALGLVFPLLVTFFVGTQLAFGGCGEILPVQRVSLGRLLSGRGMRVGASRHLTLPLLDSNVVFCRAHVRRWAAGGGRR